MMSITRYRLKPFMTKAETGEMMALFANVGATSGEVAHYVDTAGGGGWIVVESDDPTMDFANSIRYAPYMVLETSIVIPVGAAVPSILESLA